ncbi:MAG TPA: hypothetical protein VFL82_05965 [Thermomicrobiales bacterium]|nr:hypothetical protein [Thermomicrobiales bacterium]
MAITYPHGRETVAVWPPQADLAADRVLFAYNPLADELVVAFGGANRPAIMNPVEGDASNYLQLRLDLETERTIVGAQIDSARRVANAKYPHWNVLIDATEAASGMRALPPSMWPEVTSFLRQIRDIAQR